MQHDRIHQLSSNITEVGRLPQDRSSVTTSLGLCATITTYRPERPWQNLKHEFLFLCSRSHCFDAALPLITSDCISVTTANCFIISYLWLPCAADADIIIFALWCLLSRPIFFISSPNLSGRRVDVYHTCTHGVALVQI